jgi:hypothetical protein
MNIYRATDPMIVKSMHFVDDCDHTAQYYMEELALEMFYNADNVFVVVVYEGDELIAHTCAIKLKENNYIWSYNAWSKSQVYEVYDKPPETKDNTNGRKKNGYAQQMIKQWAVEKFGIHEMRCRTFLDPEMLKRIWGWEILSHEMTLKF